MYHEYTSTTKQISTSIFKRLQLNRTKHQHSLSVSNYLEFF